MERRIEGGGGGGVGGVWGGWWCNMRPSISYASLSTNTRGMWPV
jgi:hypothetical protein